MEVAMGWSDYIFTKNGRAVLDKQVEWLEQNPWIFNTWMFIGCICAITILGIFLALKDKSK